jgi:hypothetical protein
MLLGCGPSVYPRGDGLLSGQLIRSRSIAFTRVDEKRMEASSWLILACWCRANPGAQHLFSSVHVLESEPVPAP